MKEYNLEQLKYTELQKLAKKRGIKANLKTSELISALSKCIAEEESTKTLFPKNDAETPGLLKDGTGKKPGKATPNFGVLVLQEQTSSQESVEQADASEKMGKKTRKKAVRKGKRAKNQCNKTVNDQTTSALNWLSEQGDPTCLALDKEAILHTKKTEHRLVEESKTDVTFERSLNTSILNADKPSAEKITDPVKSKSTDDCKKDQIKLEVIGQKVLVKMANENGDVTKKNIQKGKGRHGRKIKSTNEGETEVSNDDERACSLSQQHSSALHPCRESSFSSKSVNSTDTIDLFQNKEHKHMFRQQKRKMAQRRVSAAEKAAAMSPVSAALVRGAYLQENASFSNKSQTAASSPQNSTVKTTYLSPTVASLSKRAGQKSAALFSPALRRKRSASVVVLENSLPQKKQKTIAEQTGNGKKAEGKESNSGHKTSRRSSERIRAKVIPTNANLMADAEAKKEILAEVEKNIQEKRENGELPPSMDVAASHIPRFVAFTMGKSTTRNTPAGSKDWAKIHQKQFDKMESIDVYLAKKRKRNEELTASVKRAQQVAMATKQAMDRLTETVQKPFVPTVTSVKKVNMNFASIKSHAAAATRKVEVLVAERSKKPPPLRKSVRGDAQIVKDFKAPTPQKKFDLQESLRRTLPYKPYVGKLKPLSSAENRQIARSHMHPTNTHQQRGGVNSIRESGRQNLQQKRSTKRTELQMQRRQITT